MRNALNFQFPNQIARRLQIKHGTLQDVLNRKDNLYLFDRRNIDGKERDIFATQQPLKTVLRELHLVLREIPLPDEFVGGIPRRSIFFNVRRHIGRNFVLNLDLENFYPSIKPQYINSVFKRLGCNDAMAKLLTYLTTAKNQLPQGFPTSTMLSAFVLAPMAEELRKVLSPTHVFSFWVDDLTISGDSDPSVFIPKIRQICKKYGMKLKERKTYLGVRGHTPQEVTGIIITGTDISPAKQFLPNTKEMLRVFKKSGWEGVNAEQGWGCTSKEEVITKLKGRIRFIEQFDKAKGEKLLAMLTEKTKVAGTSF